MLFNATIAANAARNAATPTDNGAQHFGAAAAAVAAAERAFFAADAAPLRAVVVADDAEVAERKRAERESFGAQQELRRANEALASARSAARAAWKVADAFGSVDGVAGACKVTTKRNRKSSETSIEVAAPFNPLGSPHGWMRFYASFDNDTRCWSLFHASAGWVDLDDAIPGLAERASLARVAAALRSPLVAAEVARLVARALDTDALAAEPRVDEAEREARRAGERVARLQFGI